MDTRVGATQIGDPNHASQINLSREEVLFVLHQLGLHDWTGLDADPLGEVGPELQPRILAVAARALQARALAQRTEDGWTLDEAIRDAVTICAYAPKAIYVYHWPVGAELPTRTFCHVLDGRAAIHTYPAEGQHQFNYFRQANPTHLANTVLAACGGVAPLTLVEQIYRLPSTRFAEARGRAIGGDPAAAAALLAEDDLPDLVVSPLLAAVTGAAAVSIIQLATQVDDRLDQIDCTLVQAAGSDGAPDATWLIEVAPANGGMLTVRPLSPDSARTLLLPHVS